MSPEQRAYYNQIIEGIQATIAQFYGLLDDGSGIVQLQLVNALTGYLIIQGAYNVRPELTLDEQGQTQVIFHDRTTGKLILTDVDLLTYFPVKRATSRDWKIDYTLKPRTYNPQPWEMG